MIRRDAKYATLRKNNCKKIVNQSESCLWRSLKGSIKKSTSTEGLECLCVEINDGVFFVFTERFQKWILHLIVKYRIQSHTRRGKQQTRILRWSLRWTRFWEQEWCAMNISLRKITNTFFVITKKRKKWGNSRLSEPWRRARKVCRCSTVSAVKRGESPSQAIDSNILSSIDTKCLITAEGSWLKYKQMNEMIFCESIFTIEWNGGVLSVRVSQQPQSLYKNQRVVIGVIVRSKGTSSLRFCEKRLQFLSNMPRETCEISRCSIVLKSWPVSTKAGYRYKGSNGINEGFTRRDFPFSDSYLSNSFFLFQSGFFCNKYRFK